MVDVGVDRPLAAMVELVREVVRDLDVEQFDAPTAARVVEHCAEAERLLGALRVLAAATLQDKAVWRREGFRSTAAWMSSLVETASKVSLKGLREECRRVEATGLDMEARHRRAHCSRRIRSWVDGHGVGRLSARMAPDELARLVGEIDRRCDDIVVDAVRGGWFESVEAHRADALVDLAYPLEPGSRPDVTVHVVVDYDALVRGGTISGERCEIPGVGPIPVSVARRLAEDAFLKVLVTKGVDIQAVAHGGRTIPAHLRSALELRDPKRIVPRCDVRRGLEIDHRDSFARTGLTSLDNTARLCRWHHYQKTFLGYSYRGGPGTWQWIPPEHRDQDLTALSKLLSARRRC